MTEAKGLCPNCRRVWAIRHLIESNFNCPLCNYSLRNGSVVAVKSSGGKVLTPCTTDRANREVQSGRAWWDSDGTLWLYDSPEHNAHYRSIVFKRDCGTCLWCGDSANTVDHIIPYSEGGLYHPVNLMCACGACNQKRQNDDAFLFLELLAGEGRTSPYAGYVVERYELAGALVHRMKESQERRHSPYSG